MSKLKESQHLKIPFQLIKEATQNFKTCIGKGGYGLVYKGQLLISAQPTTVAVKRLYEQFGQGSKEFLTEIELLKGQKHPNLISLLGYCEEKEVVAFLFVTKHDEEQLRTSVDEVFSLYHKYIDGKKGLTYHGLLQYYDDDHSDLDSDILPLLSDSDDSNKHKKLKWLLEKLNSNKDAGLNEQALAASHKPLQKIGNLPVKVFNWYRKKGLASSSLLTKDGYDDTRDQFDLDFNVLELLLKPDDDDALLLERPPESEHRIEPLTT